MLSLKEFTFLVLSLAFCLPLKAQDPAEKSSWYDIITVEKDFTYADLVSLSDDSLMVENVRGRHNIALDEIIGIRTFKQSPKGTVGITILAGAVIGGALGAKAHKDAQEEYENSDALIKTSPTDHTGLGILLGGLCGAIIGGLANSSSKKDEYVDLRQKSRNQLIAFLRRHLSIKRGRG